MASETTTTATKPSLRTDRVRLVVLMAPKPGLSFEEFDRYWLDVHANVFSSIPIAKRNLLKYEQFHLDPKYDGVIAASSLAKSKSLFRGIAIFEATSLDKIFEIFQDKDYLEKVVPDELKFFDHENAQMLAGPFATIIDL
ncbi:hypothetical protein C8T65DRAFT_569796 [Cerioporus squamosus]|nr:hypothetical protein C8T65DRAFT_569796 [Cerioporus squamosus]